MKISKILIFVSIFMLTGCGKDEAEKREEAILKAQILLNDRNCDKAIEVLEKAGIDNLSADFLGTYASAYACRASFDEPDFFDLDLPDVAAGTLLNGMGQFTSTNPMTTATDTDFTNLQAGINILLYAGNVGAAEEPTVARRAVGFSSEAAGDINIQAFFMVLAQLGSYYKYYGNPNATGVKGLGAGTNTCFLDYSENIAFDSGPPDMTTYLGGGITGLCNQVSDVGHPDLGATGSMNNTRVCQGIVLMNHLLELIPVVVDNFSGGNLGSINQILLDMDARKTQLASLKAGAVALSNSFNQANCEVLAAADDDAVQAYFAIFFEFLFP